jgi:uncharacterized RDD family membrane protein YckC
VIATDQASATAAASSLHHHDGVASIRARAGGYVVDMVIFTAIAMVMLVAAGFVLLLQTDFGTGDPSDPDLYLFLGIFGLGTPLVWALLNIALLIARAQTGGQYVAGVRLLREDGGRPTAAAAAAWLLCLNPLMFSWPMAAVAGGPLALVFALVLSRATLIVWLFIVLLCIAMPLVSALAALLDERNRTLHDRIMGTVVVPAT